MSRLKILIVEDDNMISESLREMIEILNHTVVGLADNAEDAIELCNQHSPQLALLDIQIGGDIDGVDLAEIINEQFDIPFIFTTAFADDVTIGRAKETSPFGYLVKPYGIKDINAAIAVAMGVFERLKKTETLKTISKVIDGSIFLKVDSKLIKVNIEDILYIEAKGDYTLFKTYERGYIVHSTIAKVQDRLGSYGFQKVHRSFVINLSKIVSLEESKLLIAGNTIPISRSNKETLINRLNIY